jgi:hypothetical protein
MGGMMPLSGRANGARFFGEISIAYQKNESYIKK